MEEHQQRTASSSGLALGNHGLSTQSDMVLFRRDRMNIEYESTSEIDGQYMTQGNVNPSE